MAQSKNDSPKGSPANVYLFYGEEAYKRRNYKEKLKKQIAGDGSINYAFFEGKDIDFSAVYDSVVTLPFFADKRLVVVENSGKFKAAAKKGVTSEQAGSEDNAGIGNDAGAGNSASAGNFAGAGNSASAGNFVGAGNNGEGRRISAASAKKLSAQDAMIEKILSDLPETTCLAFFEEEVNKTKKIYKTIASRGKVIECAPDSKDVVLKWLARGFAGDNKKIRQSTAELIIDRIGCDYDRLRKEYEKIVAYAGDRDVITDEDVLAVTSEDIESRIFDMLDAMSARNTQRVIEYYYGLIANKEHPLYLLAMIRIQFRTMLQVAELDMEGRSKYEIASRLKKRDFVVEKSLRNLRYFSPSRIEEILDIISDTDKRIKSGDIDEQIGVETMLIDFSK